MGGVATCISMRARAWSTTTLSFGMAGILSDVPVRLGQFLPAFDLGALYKTLVARPTSTTDASQLLYNSGQIDTAVLPSAIAYLRAEDRRAVLDQAVNLRQNQYLAKYQAQTQIAQIINDEYNNDATNNPNGAAQTKASLLSSLRETASLQYSSLASSYQTDGLTSVVTYSKTNMAIATSSTDNATETAGTTSQTLEGAIPGANFQPLPTVAQAGAWGFSGTKTMNATDEEEQTDATSQTTGTSNQTGTIYNHPMIYRIPYVESQAQGLRAQINLKDEYVAAYVSSVVAGSMPTIYANELSNIDSRVYQLQINYLNSYLLPVVAGYVTGVYKHPGEWVQPGEPVARIEDWDRIYILARLKYDGVINSVSSTVTVATPMPGTPATTLWLSCAVVSVRGGPDEKLYDVILSVENPKNPNISPIFPPGHKFVLGATTVTVVDK